MSLFGNLAWFGPLKGMQKLFFRTPLVHAFILGSETYHDYYRWPVKDRRVFEEWKRTTPWGRCRQSYSPVDERLLLEAGDADHLAWSGLQEYLRVI